MRDEVRRRRLRDLLWPWIVREVRVNYRQTALDLWWSLVTPVIVVAGYGLVLTRFFGVDGGGLPYLSFAWSGMVMWTFFAAGALGGAWSLVYAADLVRKVAFPREVVPFAVVAAAGFELAIGLGILLVLMAIQSVPVTITALSSVVVLAAFSLFVGGVAVVLATMTGFVRDVAHAVSTILRVGIFITPVLYPVTTIPPDLRWVVSVNPVAVYIESFRDGLMRGVWPDWPLLGIHSLLAVVLAVASVAYIRRVGGRLADVI